MAAFSASGLVCSAMPWMVEVPEMAWAVTAQFADDAGRLPHFLSPGC